MTIGQSGEIRKPAAITVRDLERRFGSVRAVRDISFNVAEGSLCGLVGPNGAGKTTTLRILATDLVPTDGEVRVLGCELPREKERLRPRIGYMPEAAGLYEELTLREYLGFFAQACKLQGGKQKDAVETAMDLAGVRSFADRRLQGLSKGEKQRILLARALIHDPELLILDEPADGLDPKGRVELRELLLLLHERGKTILISSHILSDLEEISTDLILVDRGRVVFQGDRAKLVAGGFLQTRVLIETPDNRDLLLRLLGAYPGVAVVQEGEAVEIEIPPEATFAQDLLHHLVRSGVRVTSFARRVESLEETYLRLLSPEER